jgi:hypothetical protein
MSPSKLAATQTGTLPAARAPRSRLMSRVMVKRNSAPHVEHNAHNLLIAACAVCAHNRATASADT